MPILLDIVEKQMAEHTLEKSAKSHLVTDDVLCADDTILIAESAGYQQKHLDTIILVSKTFGLDLNAGKTIPIRIRSNRSDATIIGPDGAAIPCKESAMYLGGLLNVDGRPCSELTKRLGEAKGAFEKIRKIWDHVNLSKQRTLDVFGEYNFIKTIASPAVPCAPTGYRADAQLKSSQHEQPNDTKTKKRGGTQYA